MDPVKKKIHKFSVDTDFQFFFSDHMLPFTMTQKIINTTYLSCDVYCIAFD